MDGGYLTDISPALEHPPALTFVSDNDFNSGIIRLFSFGWLYKNKSSVHGDYVTRICSRAHDRLSLSFVIKNPVAENALSASAGVGGIVFTVSTSFATFDDRYSVESNNCNSCFTILLKLELLLVEYLRTFVF
ncbi:hypothetical protein AVEN_249895-1 [Araneus ventricosus]|uniref:Uncharacterized protein n=1 Tax=Araneus ventricosus TaxID=182803 RepID=A0A4Y2J560_ARAVE|nr:hypothetical protein AVEN_249895-1 [Araneus ventricosus]